MSRASGRVTYVDTSALVKLVRREPESDRLRAVLAKAETLVTSRLTAIELGRVCLRAAIEPARARAVLASIVVVEITAGIAARASDARPEGLRSLDAIHLSTALELGDDLAALVTYDRRLAEAAAFHGLGVMAP